MRDFDLYLGLEDFIDIVKVLVVVVVVSSRLRNGVLEFFGNYANFCYEYCFVRKFLCWYFFWRCGIFFLVVESLGR